MAMDSPDGPPIICYAPSMITTNGVWQGDNPLDYTLPLLIVQITMIVLTTRLLMIILKPVRQPRVIAEILAGVILGPSLFGRSAEFARLFFPVRSVMVLETVANVGLLYFLFLVGVEMDIAVIKRTGKKAISIALGGMILPFVIGCTFSVFIRSRLHGGEHHETYVLFLGVTLAVTAFPVLARILAELKLTNTEMGRIAMSAALVSDIFAWILLAVAIALGERSKSSYTSLLVIVSNFAFVVVCIFLVRPAILWMIQRTPEGEPYSDFCMGSILAGVMAAGLITDAIGTHSVFGAFVFGLIIPNGPLGVILIEKLEDFVSGIFLPLFFAISGLKTDMTKIKGVGTWSNLMVVIVLACIGKVAGTAVVAYGYKMPLREGITLGLLMNTKGLVEIIVLNVGRDQQILDEGSFAIMIVAALIMTSVVGPLVTTVYRPSRRFAAYKRRTIQSSKADAEFRILTCLHTPRSVPTIINLLEASNPTKRSPICVYALHLVELSGRASAMLIVHNTRKSGKPALNRTQAQSDSIINAFENYEQNAANVTVQPLTAISPYPTMHEDICHLSQDKRVALIILPFHKQQTVDGSMESLNSAYRMVNQNVLANVPCTVGVLIDRGLKVSIRGAKQASHKVLVLFLGGPDDREALAYAWRMSDNPNMTLTVLRFLPGEEEPETVLDPNDPEVITVITDGEHQQQQDNMYIKDFRMKTEENKSITYTEITVDNGEETVAAIGAIERGYDLYIVGRGHMVSPLTAGLTDWSECPELGTIGDILASSDFSSTVSVLVVQQYIGAGLLNETDSTPESPAGNVDIDDQLTAGMQISHRQHPAKGQDIF